MGYVLFAVRTEYLNIIQTSLGFKGLKEMYQKLCKVAKFRHYTVQHITSHHMHTLLEKVRNIKSTGTSAGRYIPIKEFYVTYNI